ncbi:hypothetical protein IscW_ISCW003380, partial [Ixodes scapularis]
LHIVDSCLYSHGSPSSSLCTLPTFSLRKAPALYKHDLQKKKNKKKRVWEERKLPNALLPGLRADNMGRNRPASFQRQKAQTPLRSQKSQIYMYTQTRLRTLWETGKGTLEGRDDVWYQSLGKWNGEGRLGQRTYCSRPQSENGRIRFSTQSRPETSKCYRGYKTCVKGKKTEAPPHHSQPASDCNNHNSEDVKTECAIQLRFRFGETRHGSTANMEWVCTFEKCIVARRKDEPLPFTDLCVDTPQCSQYGTRDHKSMENSASGTQNACMVGEG